MQQVHSNSPDAAPEIQLFEGFEASHAGWYAPQHVVSNIETLQLAEVAHAVWQAVQVVGAQVQLHQGLAGANVIWQSIYAIVLQPQDLQGCHARQTFPNFRYGVVGQVKLSAQHHELSDIHVHSTMMLLMFRIL